MDIETDIKSVRSLQSAVFLSLNLGAAGQDTEIAWLSDSPRYIRTKFQCTSNKQRNLTLDRNH